MSKHKKSRFSLPSVSSYLGMKRKVGGGGVRKSWYEDDRYYDSYGGFDMPLDTGKRAEWEKGKYGGSKYGSYGYGYGYEYQYYRTPSLDYRYIEKMANLFASQYAITVKVGSDTSFDLKTKTLIYNPTALMYGTKANLIATLLHEIGHLRHSTDSPLLQSEYLKKYPKAAFELVNVFEDLRIDEIMSRSYPSAAEVYEANVSIVKEQAETFLKRKDSAYDALSMLVLSVKLEGKAEIVAEIKRLRDGVSFLDYCRSILLTGYGQKPLGMNKELVDLVDRTEHAIPMAIRASSTQDVVNVLDEHVYPVVEYLMKEHEKHENKKKKIGFVIASGSNGKITKLDGMRIAEELIDRAFRDSYGGNNFLVRQNGSGNTNSIPKSWVSGDYGALKESVQSSIDELVRLLMFLRAKELAEMYESHKRRGRLDVKALYKHRTGSPYLFQKKIERVDTVSSFAFSFVIDQSGSMGGERIVHATRAIVMLSEVMDKMGIPFEIVSFTGEKKIKKFADKYDDAKKKMVAGFPLHSDGGTNITWFIDEEDGYGGIAGVLQKNKIVVLVSDGDIYYNNGEANIRPRFDELKQDHGIKSLGVGVITDEPIHEMTSSGGAIVQDAVELPDVFAKILKDAIIDRKI